MSASLNDKFTDTFNSADPNVAKVTAVRTSGATTLACDNLSGWPTASKVHFSTYQIDTNNAVVDGTQVDWEGIVSSNSIGSLTRLAGASDNGNAIGDIVEMNPTAKWAQDLADGLTKEHNRDGTHADGSIKTPYLSTDVRGGWYSTTATLSYTSWDSTNKTGVMASDTDLTGVISVGQKMQITQTTVKYFFVTAITSSSITGYFGTDYTLANATITSPKYSPWKAPVGFPLDPAKWTVSVSSSSDRFTSSSTYTSFTDAITIPIGVWDVRFKAVVVMDSDATTTVRMGFVILSSDGSTETNPELTLAARVKSPSAAQTTAGGVQSASSQIAITSATTYTMMAKTNAGSGVINVMGSTLAPTRFKAVCAYL